MVEVTDQGPGFFEPDRETDEAGRDILPIAMVGRVYPLSAGSGGSRMTPAVGARGVTAAPTAGLRPGPKSARVIEPKAEDSEDYDAGYLAELPLCVADGSG